MRSTFQTMGNALVLTTGWRKPLFCNSKILNVVFELKRLSEVALR
jgi:hypothetical protein